ncbi:rRNA maturation RNase YbeY [bacterium]|nr:rRNA maturation RNase YbeY [bacterium]
MDIQIQENKKANKYRNIILQAGEKTLSFMGKEKKSLGILITDEHQIRQLNKKFRNTDEPTDVLAFPYGEKRSPYLGDIAISLMQAKEQAKTYKEKLEDELARLVIHGVLHLLGETDYTSKSKEKMWAKQEKILTSLKEKN